MDWVWVLIPIFALLIPVVAIFSHHQQRMAQILHQNPGASGEFDALRRELADLKSLVHQQTVTLDNIANAQKSLSSPPPTPNLSDRLSANG